MRFRAWLRRVMPRAETIAALPGVRRILPALAVPELWRLERRRVARGLAIGACLGVIVPAGQMIAAAATALALRGNVPAAALGTFVTNPFTVVPIYSLAHVVGSLTLGLPVEVPGGLAELGKPLVIGSLILAGCFAACAWLLVSLLWRLEARGRLRQRMFRPRGDESAARPGGRP